MVQKAKGWVLFGMKIPCLKSEFSFFALVHKRMPFTAVVLKNLLPEQKRARMNLVIFDVDGTLVHSDRRDSRSFAATYQRLYDRPFPSIDWTKFPHVTDTTIFSTVIREHFKRAVDAAEVAIFQREYISRLKTERQQNGSAFQEVTFARRTVERLLQEGFHVGIATGGWLEPAKVKLQHVGIDPEQLFLSAADGKTTREAIIEQVLEQVDAQQLQPQRIVYVGDALWDVTTTRNMGLNFIGIRHKGDVDVLRQAGASHVLQDYASYEQFVEAFHNAKPPENQI